MKYSTKTSVTKAMVICFLIVVCAAFRLNAQKAKDVLEKGQHVKSGYKIFLRKEGNVLKYDVNQTPKDLTTLEDDMIFLVEKNELNIYIRPLNPLNFQLNTANVVIVDPISEAEGNASKELFDVLGTITKDMAAQAVACGMYDNGTSTLEELRKKLSVDQKPKMVESFKKMKSLTFEDELRTSADLDKIDISITELEDYYKKMQGDIDAVNDIIKKYDCPDPPSFIVKFVFTATLKDLEVIRNEQLKRLANLRKCYKLVRDAQINASIEKDGLKWFVLPPAIPATEGKISVYTITISEGGYDLSADNEIVATNSKELIKKSLKVRKFQRFVPEVSAGTAYTFFEYPQFGTSKDAGGNIIVADAGKKSINNLKFTAMINYNFFLSYSPVHPFWQIGVGANSEIPTLFTGLGIRANFAGARRLALAGGCAFTWIKQLNKLKIGDKVSGTTDIDKDLHYQFNKKKPFYLGIQYNF